MLSGLIAHGCEVWNMSQSGSTFRCCVNNALCALQKMCQGWLAATSGKKSSLFRTNNLGLLVGSCEWKSICGA
ncbi:hypothetical protein KC360_g99 [Hortaea werneckii]|nr:hypothetical protein KC360_g99 [Hortaea werneckii]